MRRVVGRGAFPAEAWLCQGRQEAGGWQENDRCCREEEARCKEGSEKEDNWQEDSLEEVYEQESSNKKISCEEGARSQENIVRGVFWRQLMASQIDRAVAALRSGGVVAYPTEAVWGLGCDPLNEDAVARLFRLKQRPLGQGVLLIGSSFEQFSDFVGLCPEPALARAKATWPGPSTWIFPRNDRVPAWIVGEHAGIALRVTDHPVASQLCKAYGSALISTSANRHGQAAATSADEVRAIFGNDLGEIVEGKLGGLERPTPIRDAISGELLRS